MIELSVILKKIDVYKYASGNLIYVLDFVLSAMV